MERLQRHGQDSIKSECQKFCNFLQQKTEEMWKEAWYLAKIEDTEKILKEVGFRNF
jgi:hypothetical protein